MTATAMAGMSAAEFCATARKPILLFPGRNNPLTHSPSPSSSMVSTLGCRRSRSSRGVICCEVAVRSDSSIESESESEELKSNLEKVGRKVRVKAPLKVYHVAKLPDLELTPDMVGVIKQYVGFWKGKRISPNLPFKVEFVADVEGRGHVKFLAHLKEDEFDII